MKKKHFFMYTYLTFLVDKVKLNEFNVLCK